MPGVSKFGICRHGEANRPVTYYLPEFINDCRILVPTEDDGCYLISNAELQAGTDGPAYRKSKTMDDRASGKNIVHMWGRKAQGILHDGWLEVQQVFNDFDGTWVRESGEQIVVKDGIVKKGQEGDFIVSSNSSCALLVDGTLYVGQRDGNVLQWEDGDIWHRDEAAPPDQSEAPRIRVGRMPLLPS